MSTENMKISLSSAITNAVMNKKPLVIVEGKDDLGIYCELINGIDEHFNIKPIEYFKDCSPGCKEIERKITEINSIYPTGHKAYSFFKGIVDRDTKYFRGELLARDGILYLDSYSFESEFVSESSIIDTVKLLTAASHEQLNIKLSQKLLDLINEQFTDFYYIALEALKNAVIDGYQGLVGFSDGYEQMLNAPNMKEALKNKRTDLDLFASSMNIAPNGIISMKSYCKGKWHLRYFLSSVQNLISGIHAYCGRDLSSCPYCEVGEHHKCLYKPAMKMNIEHVIKAVKNNLNNADLDYIKVEIGKMKS
jgi:hypothetical protein